MGEGGAKQHAKEPVEPKSAKRFKRDQRQEESGRPSEGSHTLWIRPSGEMGEKERTKERRRKEGGGDWAVGQWEGVSGSPPRTAIK